MENFWKELKKPIIGLAPMDGVTDEPMRQIQCSISKPDVIYTEFVSVEGFIKKPDAFQKTLFFQENERPIVAQLFGYTPEFFYEAISKIAEIGFNGIDINMGCPAKSVLQKGGGGALIGNYDLAEKIIKKSLEAIKELKKPVCRQAHEIPLSIKTRIGKDKIITDDWISFLSDFPVSEITVHGRLLRQGNAGEVNWKEIAIAAKIARDKKIICLGNGGIKSISEAKQKIKDFDLDGVLVGQAALGNPWFFKENYLPTREEILKTIIDHSRIVNDFYPPKRFVTVLKHLGWYPKGFPNCIKLKVELLKCKNLEQVIEVVRGFKENF